MNQICCYVNVLIDKLGWGMGIRVFLPKLENTI